MPKFQMRNRNVNQIICKKSIKVRKRIQLKLQISIRENLEVRNGYFLVK